MQRFIVIDGTDGCGKDTQAYLLTRELIKEGQNVMLRIHPSPTIFGRITKKGLERGGKAFVLIATLFFIADIFWSWKFYFKKKFDSIIFVRYLMTTAYLPSSLIRIGYVFFASFLPDPDLAIYLDVIPETSMKRITARGGKLEEFETIDKLKKKRGKMAILAREFGWVTVNGNGTIEEVFKDVNRELSNIIS
ncbi:MAG: thymidylate kinase [Candidatus Hodarchaeales archaeon]|jgi:dTMP kinase